LAPLAFASEEPTVFESKRSLHSRSNVGFENLSGIALATSTEHGFCVEISLPALAAILLELRATAGKMYLSAVLALLMHAARIVVCAGDDDRQVSPETPQLCFPVPVNENAIALSSRLERLEPPEIAVLRVLIDPRVGLGRGSHPCLIHDAPSLPSSAFR